MVKKSKEGFRNGFEEGLDPQVSVGVVGIWGKQYRAAGA
jgi:hypothetical protein